jgi:hypothetical protein
MPALVKENNMKKVQRLVIMVLALATLSISFAGVTGHTKPTGNRVTSGNVIAKPVQ